MDLEDISVEIKEMRIQLNSISAGMAALVNEAKNQSKIKNDHNKRLTIIEQSRGPTREEFATLERRTDFLEVNESVTKKEGGMYKASAYFVFNALILIICAIIGKFV
jgi:hypothetical protein